jgi:ribosome-binding protein aMBF1 (putative translation factor)
MAKTSNAVRILDKMIGKDLALRRRVEQEEENLRVARMMYDARTKAGLTQSQLARLIGTKQPVISQLEDANYRGHSLTMLRRIAAALGKRLRIDFVDRHVRRSA